MILGSVCAGCRSDAAPPLNIAVMLPMTGPEYEEWEKPLEWALENINRSGVAGRQLELVYVDIAKEDPVVAASRLAADASILAVIGPHTSQSVYDVAPFLIQAQKVMVTPSATSAEIFRAFSPYKYVWRTVESDVAQMRTMLTVAARDGAKTVALITSAEQYGATFFDWFGFFATELGLETTGIRRYDESAVSFDECLSDVLSGKPDALLAVPISTNITVEIIRRTGAEAAGTRLIFSDAGMSSDLIQRLGQAADGIEGFALVADGDNGFNEAFAARFQTPPTPYAANVYDALTLIAYGLERSGGRGGERLTEAMAEVVDGRGPATGWDKTGVTDALSAVRAGELPDVSGATGPLDYDRDFHMDMTSSTYGFWRIEDGEYRIVEYITTGDSPTATDGKAAFQSLASEYNRQDIMGGTAYEPGLRTGLWAVIVATSGGWGNYRHQADALAQYRLLRSNGVTDDRIILIVADDIADHPLNPEPGTVRNVTRGEELYVNVEVDYRLDQVDAKALLAILAGEKSAALPTVVESTSGDNIYLFMVGHGNLNGVYLGLNEAVPDADSEYSILKPADLSEAVAAMSQQARYRRMLIVVESCHGGIMGSGLEAPGALLIASANPFENSLSANYEPSQGIWLADQFAYQLRQVAALDPGITIDHLYQSLYLRVNGSHVSAYAPAFGDIDAVKLEEFITP
jgi:ABC-type branched-subunit amino acid transport system substrate-binding protein/glycosylphosphatidylinositol transamidase (GPIT) subunit GPI8